MKDMNAGWATGAPRILTNTGTQPGGLFPTTPAPVVVIVVLVAVLVATIGVRLEFCCSNCRMAAAFVDEAIASEAKHATAIARIDKSRIGSFLLGVNLRCVI